MSKHPVYFMGALHIDGSGELPYNEIYNMKAVKYHGERTIGYEA